MALLLHAELPCSNSTCAAAGDALHCTGRVSPVTSSETWLNPYTSSEAGTCAAAVAAAAVLHPQLLCASVYAAVPLASSALLRFLVTGAGVTSQRRVGCHSLFAWSWKTGVLTEPIICASLYPGQVASNRRPPPQGTCTLACVYVQALSLPITIASAEDKPIGTLS